MKDHKRIKDEILTEVMSKLKTIFSLGSMPGLSWKMFCDILRNWCFSAMKDMREIAYTLSHVYPAMFCNTGGISEFT